MPNSKARQNYKSNTLICKTACALFDLLKFNVWSKLVFTTEIISTLDDLPNEPYLLSKLVQGGCSVLIWSSFCAQRKTSLVFTKTKMNFFDYQYVLGNIFIPHKDDLKFGITSR